MIEKIQDYVRHLLIRWGFKKCMGCGNKISNNSYQYVDIHDEYDKSLFEILLCEDCFQDVVVRYGSMSEFVECAIDYILSEMEDECGVECENDDDAYSSCECECMSCVKKAANKELEGK